MTKDRLATLLNILTLIIIAVCVYVEVSRDRQAFMNECQMDGMKHYYCVSLWNGGGIPVFRSRDMVPLDVN
jgi:hypothetical protein